MVFSNNQIVIILLGFVVSVIAQDAYQDLKTFHCVEGNRTKSICYSTVKIRDCKNLMYDGRVCQLRLPGIPHKISFELIAFDDIRAGMVKIEGLDGSNNHILDSNFSFQLSPDSTIYAYQWTYFKEMEVIFRPPSSISRSPGFMDIYKQIKKLQYNIIDEYNSTRACCFAFNVFVA